MIAQVKMRTVMSCQAAVFDEEMANLWKLWGDIHGGKIYREPSAIGNDTRELVVAQVQHIQVCYIGQVWNCPSQSTVSQAPALTSANCISFKSQSQNQKYLLTSYLALLCKCCINNKLPATYK
jgi:hypothetical protein